MDGRGLPASGVALVAGAVADGTVADGATPARATLALGFWAAGRSMPPLASTKATDRTNEAARTTSAPAMAGVTVRFERAGVTTGSGRSVGPSTESSGTHPPYS